MNYKDLADLIFPEVKLSIEDLLEKYPSRDLEKGAKVTRVAPSPTGYLHIGGFYQILTDYIYAKKSNGVFILRIEDTDQAREVSDAAKLIFDSLKYYNIAPDEFEDETKVVGEYGPYYQSKRKEIYHVFIKHLIEKNMAYPCFCKKEDLEELRTEQESKKIRIGYYKEHAICRNLTPDEAAKLIKEGTPYGIRFRSMGDFDNKVIVDDAVKGRIELPENDQDIIIMKAENKLPTYHFAHVVDDTLMHTTHVIRGEDWLPSTPVHLQLFKAFGFKVPTYLHTPLIVKQDGDKIRKISKRKDPEASMSYFEELGYPTLAVIESIMTIINSNYESWHTANPNLLFTDFDFSPKKMSSSGSFYDLEKLDNISKNYLSKLSASEVYDNYLDWTKKYDLDMFELINKYSDYTTNILNIERVQKKPRKDYANYSSIKNQIWYMYDELFDLFDNYEFQLIDNIEANVLAKDYLENFYNETDEKDVWFNKIKELSVKHGYCDEVKVYKENPDAYKGHVGDVSTALRVMLTKRSMTPDLYAIMNLLGKERMLKRTKN
ncbi:MAG: glutamate--tRNA ligase [Mycoplasmatota bacterium]